MPADPLSPASENDVRLRAWMDRARPEDVLWAAAYEAAGAETRARCKLCIARLHAYWGEREPLERAAVRYRQGFSLESETRPAPFALIVCAANAPHADALLAAVMPATLAGVPLVLPCLVRRGKDEKIADPLLAALELAGAEESVVTGNEDATKGFSLLHAALGLGRLVILGKPEGWTGLVLKSLEFGVPVQILEREGTALCVDPYHEGVWIWPGLGPDWFRARSLALTE